MLVLFLRRRISAEFESSSDAAVGDTVSVLTEAMGDVGVLVSVLLRIRNDEDDPFSWCLCWCLCSSLYSFSSG